MYGVGVQCVKRKQNSRTRRVWYVHTRERSAHFGGIGSTVYALMARVCSVGVCEVTAMRVGCSLCVCVFSVQAAPLCVYDPGGLYLMHTCGIGGECAASILVLESNCFLG